MQFLRTKLSLYMCVHVYVCAHARVHNNGKSSLFSIIFYSMHVCTICVDACVCVCVFMCVYGVCMHYLCVCVCVYGVCMHYLCVCVCVLPAVFV